MSNPTPQDPLTNATLSVPEESRIGSSIPVAYRLASEKIAPNFKLLKLQGAFKTWNDQGMVQHEWRDIPTVEL